MVLAGMTAVIAVPLALCLGVLAALYRNGLFDRFVNGATLTTISITEFLHRLSPGLSCRLAWHLRGH